MSEVAVRTPQQQLVSQIRSVEFRGQVALALPENVTPERFTRIAITALQASPNIVDCDHASIIRALLQSAAMGLMPDGREAALVPFKGKAMLIPMIAGYRHIAADYGWTIITAVAYEHDEFEYEQGLDVRFRHTPVRPGRDRGQPIAAYAVGKHQDGRRELEVLTVDEVEKVRATSQTGARADSPWAQWWEQMAEKTAGKRLFKKLPLSEDDKRVRIISAAALTPGEAAAALYGPQARAALERPPVHGEIVDGRVHTDTPDALPADGEQAEVEPAAAGQQEDAAASSPEAAASSPDTDPDPEPQPGPAAEQAQFEIPDQVISDAAAYVVPSGAWKSRSIEEVAAAGEDGERWFSWVLANPGRVHAPTLDAVTTYVQALRPDLLRGART